MKRGVWAGGQRGAALIVVLLLVATLSFLVLGISERMTLASSLAANARIRTELLWRIVGVEAAAVSAIRSALSQDGFRYAPDHPFFAAAIDIPMEKGGAELRFRDATRCFNLNGLVTLKDGVYSKDEDALKDFAALMRAADADQASAEIAATIIDWIDSDGFQEPGGAEDGAYLGLPAPYRTGGTLLADISEVRAMRGVDRDRFARLASVACALPIASPSPINVNLLEPGQGAVLVGALGGAISLAEAESAIQDRPPAGYASIEEFWKLDIFREKNLPAPVKSRPKLTSQFIEAYAAVRFIDQTAGVRTLLELAENGEARLVSRRIETGPQ